MVPILCFCLMFWPFYVKKDRSKVFSSIIVDLIDLIPSKQYHCIWKEIHIHLYFNYLMIKYYLNIPSVFPMIHVELSVAFYIVPFGEIIKLQLVFVYVDFTATPQRWVLWVFGRHLFPVKISHMETKYVRMLMQYWATQRVTTAKKAEQSGKK